MFKFVASGPLGLLLSLLALIGIAWILGELASLPFQSPFRFPYFHHVFNITNIRNPSIDSIIDNYLLNGGFSEIEAHLEKIDEWDKRSRIKADRSLMRELRNSQYLRASDEDHAFVFHFVWMRSTYKGGNVMQVTYRGNSRINAFAYDYSALQERYFNLVQKKGEEV